MSPATASRIVVVVMLPIVCAGCGGSSSRAATPASPPLTVSPSSVTIGFPPAPATLDVANASGLITARLDNPLLAAVSVSGSKVTVLPIAAGQATLAVTAGSATVNVPLTIALCTPPNPAIVLANPASGSTGVSLSQGGILLLVQNAFGYTPATIASTIVARVVASNGAEVVTAAPVHVVPPPPFPAAQYMSFSVPTLPAGTTFTVQTYIASDPCLPPAVIAAGSFST